MSFAEGLLPEYDQEMANTRKVLERVPEDKFDWKPHEKSNTIGWNANHLAEMVNWTAGTIGSESWDIAPADGEPYQSPDLKSRDEILALFDEGVTAGRAAIEQASDEQMGQIWSLLKTGEPMFTMPKAAVIRVFVMNHLIHHRAILTVYLRMNDVPVPGMYGPSADDAG